MNEDPARSAFEIPENDWRGRRVHFDETKDRLLTHEYEYFDFIHTLLPTTLSLQEFYAELSSLYKRAVPIAGQLSLLKNYPLKEIPKLLRTGRMVYGRLAAAHRDYAPLSF